MALTRLDFTGDGSQTLYDVSFDLGFLSRSNIYVYTGDDFTVQLDYVWRSDSQIELTTPVANGVVFHIRRVVQRNKAINDYEDGAIITEGNLDASFAQNLMIQEEIQDGYAQPQGDLILDSDVDLLDHTLKNANIDMQDQRMRNLPEPIENDEPARKKDLEDVTLTVYQGTTPPTNPFQGLQWKDTNSGRLFTWYVNAGGGGQWVEAAPQAVGAAVTTDVSQAEVQSAGSTIPRALADRFADVVNVKDFGAVGDGVTDDTAAIKAAINYCPARSELYLPYTPNEYLTTSTLVIDKPISISAPTRTTIHNTSSTSGAVMLFDGSNATDDTGAYRCNVKGLSFKSDNSHGVIMRRARWCTFTNTYTDDCGRVGLLLEGCINMEFNNHSSRGNTQDGVYLVRSVTPDISCNVITFINAELGGNGRYGIHTAPYCYNLVMINPNIENSGVGAGLLSSLRGGVIQAPWCEANAKGIVMKSCEGVQVYNLHGFNNTTLDIEVQSACTNIVIEGGLFNSDIVNSAPTSVIQNIRVGATVNVNDSTNQATLLNIYKEGVGNIGNRLAVLSSSNDGLSQLSLGQVEIYSDSGNPEGNQIAVQGSLYIRNDGSTNSVLYVKESGGNSSTGWVAK